MRQIAKPLAPPNGMAVESALATSLAINCKGLSKCCSVFSSFE